MATRRKKIFDNDGISVEQTIKDGNTYSAKKSMAVPDTKTVYTSDVFETFAGYTISRVSGLINKPNQDGGTCVLCGAKTMYPTRKFCMSCFDKNFLELFEKGKSAIEDGFTTFDIEVNTNG